MFLIFVLLHIVNCLYLIDTDYQMVLQSSSLYTTIQHSRLLQKSLITQQKSGGALITYLIDSSAGLVYRSETINLEWLYTKYPEQMLKLKDYELDRLSSQRRCTLQRLPSNSNSLPQLEFSGNQLIRVHNRTVVKYLQRTFNDYDFVLPLACQEMLLAENDLRSPKMKQMFPKILKYYQFELHTNEDSWLHARIPGTKWCGAGNEYDCDGINLSTEPFECSTPPYLNSQCPHKIVSTLPIRIDQYYSPPISQRSTIELISPECSKTLCVANDGDKLLTEIDKACRQHDLCPFSDGIHQTCACDKEIRDRTHSAAILYGSTYKSDLIEAVFANSNPAWTCNNLERECSRWSFGICTEYNTWVWNWQSVNKYVPDYCPPEQSGCLSSLDEDGRLWGEVAKYIPTICV